eukprot:COSAG02_NODE_23158_length_728_cov_1.081081_1_plen_188_part_01
MRRPRSETRLGLVEMAALLAWVCCGTFAEDGTSACTDSAASNYNPSASTEDGSCTYGPCPLLNSKLNRSGANCFLADASGAWAPGWPGANTDPAPGSLTLTNSEKWIIQGLPGAPTDKDVQEGRPRPPGSMLPFRIHAEAGSDLTVRYVNIQPTQGRAEQGGGVYASGATVYLEAVVLESSELSAHDG